MCILCCHHNEQANKFPQRHYLYDNIIEVSMTSSITRSVQLIDMTDQL